MYKSEVVGKNGISARVVAKSVSAYSGQEIVTFEYDAPKCILAQINTHCMLVKNAQSSRAVPVSKVIEQIRNNPVTPVHWGSNQAGMVAGDEIDVPIKFWTTKDSGKTIETKESSREESWNFTANYVADAMEAWDRAGYHKQIVNRIGEAFTFVRGVITGTEIDNFFHLRYHPHADPYMQELARCMWEAYEQAETEVLYEGQWHTPYVDHIRNQNGDLLYMKDGWDSIGIKGQGSYALSTIDMSVEEALKVSAVACGQVSYRKLDLSEETVERVWNRLMCGDIVHASVTGHQATPMNPPHTNESDTLCYLTETKGVTHMDANFDLWSAQFKHWVMYRQTIPNESFKGKFVPPSSKE